MTMFNISEDVKMRVCNYMVSTQRHRNRTELSLLHLIDTLLYVCAEIIVLCWLIRKDAIMLNKESTFGYAEDLPIDDCS